MNHIAPRRLSMCVFCAASLIIGCHSRSKTDPTTDLSFCRISEQAGARIPTIEEVASISGTYRVPLFSADSGKRLQQLEITLVPTDTLDRFYQRFYDQNGSFRRERRKVPVLAFGDERRLKSKSRFRYPSVSLYYDQKPVVSVFAPPRCDRYGCAVEFAQDGYLLNIKQVTKDGFSGTVNAIGSATSMQVPGQPPQLLGPHFYCALKLR